MNLSNRNIDSAVENIRAFFEKSGVQKTDITKICLVVEESLLRYQNHFGAAHEFSVYKKKWFSAPKIVIRVKGEPFYPLQNEQDDDDTILSNEVMRKLLHYDEAKTIYRYENGFNELISFSTKERLPLKIPGGSTTVAIFAAIIFSFIFGFLPQEIQKILLEEVVSPSLSTLMNLIVTVTVIMIFFSIVSSICAIEDSTMLSNIGLAVLSRFFFLDLCIIAFTMAISQIFFPVATISGENSLDLEKIVNLLLSIIPTNIFDAFLKGNVLQVTIMAFVTGMSITNIGDRMTGIKKLVIELNILVFKITETVLGVIPLTIFLCVLKTLSENEFSQILTVWKPIAAGCISFAAFSLIMLIYLSLRGKTEIRGFLKKISPPFVIALATGSTVASLPQNFEACKQSLNVEEKFCNFWIPLALAVFSPSILIKIVVSAFYVAEISGNTISIMEMLIITFLAIQLGIASPKVAGGVAVSFSILLSQLGLPPENIGSLMIVNVIIGNLFAALNILIHDCELMTISHKMGFIKSDSA